MTATSTPAKKTFWSSPGIGAIGFGILLLASVAFSTFAIIYGMIDPTQALRHPWLLGITSLLMFGLGVMHIRSGLHLRRNGDQYPDDSE